MTLRTGDHTYFVYCFGDIAQNNNKNKNKKKLNLLEKMQ